MFITFQNSENFYRKLKQFPPDTRRKLNVHETFRRVQSKTIIIINESLNKFWGTICDALSDLVQFVQFNKMWKTPMEKWYF